MSKDFTPPEKLAPPVLDVDDDINPDELFDQAMSDVKPLKQLKKVAPRAPRRNGLSQISRDQSRDRQLLRDFVDGKVEFDWSLHPDHKEGGPQSHNRPLIRKLRKGSFSVQAELDLHGYTRNEAYAELEKFLDASRRKNLSCVRIIHGKGKNSKQRLGVLRQHVPKWLSMKRFSRLIIAYASARPVDGGIGATYVLLRKSSKE